MSLNAMVKAYWDGVTISSGRSIKIPGGDSLSKIIMLVQDNGKGDKTAQSETGEAARLTTAPTQDTLSKSEEGSNERHVPDENEEDDRKAYVASYNNNIPFPFETGEIVWIVKPGYRAPLGEFRITKVHLDDLFELVACATNTTHPELVEGKHLRRDI